MNIIVFKGNIIGPVYYIERFLDFVSDKRREYEYYVCDVKDEKTYNNPDFVAFAKRDNTIMFTFNNFGIGLMTDGEVNFWKAHNIHVFDCIVDHPRNYDDVFKNPPCDLTVFTLDRNHVEYIKRFFPGIKSVHFSPNGGTEVNSAIQYKDRDIDVLYMGSGQEKIENFPSVRCFKDGGLEFYSRIFEIMIENTMLSTEEAVSQYFSEKGIAVTDAELYDINENIAGFIENEVRRITKLEGMKALSDLGISVQVYGTNWIDEDYPFGESIQIHDRIGREELMEIIGHAKISLCFVPWYKRGCSEKNFDSMLNGALCVSDRSEYLMENYKDGYNIVFFDLGNPQQMAADIKWLLDNPDAAETIAHNGYETAKANDTWGHRFSKIMEIIENQRL
jgi:glycosyltransferase involved in cell wall biosynthesis